jgi:hypothetical protein
MKSYSKGTQVRWKWGNGTASGKIVQIFTDDVTKTIKGTDVVRNANSSHPAYLIEQDDGDKVVNGYN